MKLATRQLLISAAVGVGICVGSTAVQAEEIDVHVGFSGKSKALKEQFLSALPADIQVKTYNVDLLAVADYSGRQKAVTKFERARLVVLLGDQPIKILKGITVKKDLLLVDSARDGVESATWKVHLVAASVDAGGIAGKTIEIAGEGGLADAGAIREAAVIKLRPGPLSLSKAAALVVQRALGR